MKIKDKVLIVEDEQSISNFISMVLNANGYDTIIVGSGEEALTMIASHCPDLIVLDLGLPDMDGMEVLKSVRKWSNLPVVVVSARNHEHDKVDALDYGADDYLVKPFGTSELLARVRSQLRRYMTLGGGHTAPSAVTIGGVSLDDNAKTVTVDGDTVNLTPLEYDILRLLMQHPGKVFSPHEIYRRVWHEDPAADNPVAVHVRHIREKIEINPAEPRYLKVVWGKGYKMEGTAQ